MKTLADLRREGYAPEFPRTDAELALFERVLELRGLAQAPAFSADLDGDDPETIKCLAEIKAGDLRRLVEFVDSLCGRDRCIAQEAIGEPMDSEDDGEEP